jgi:Family of unknown function (DUF6086)
MSYLFEHRDEAIWEPSIEVARLLLAATSYLESRLGIPSGLDEYMSDTVDVKFDQLAGFLVALREWANLDNKYIKIIIYYIFINLMYLLYCGSSSVEEVERGYPVDWIAEARDLARMNMRRAGDQTLAGRG